MKRIAPVLAAIFLAAAPAVGQGVVDISDFNIVPDSGQAVSRAI